MAWILIGVAVFFLGPPVLMLLICSVFLCLRASALVLAFWVMAIGNVFELLGFDDFARDCQRTAENMMQTL